MSKDSELGGGGGVSRRRALQAVAGAGVGAAVWTAPRIDTLGFAPAGASHFGSQCVILSPASDDKNSQLGQNFCSTPGVTCCGQSFGNAGQVETFTFLNPTPTCSKVVVRTIPLNCDATEKNPDVGQFAVVISETVGTCDCTVLDAVLVASSGRAIVAEFNNGPKTCGTMTGVDGSIPCDQAGLFASSRLAVRITCQAGVGCT